MSTKVSIIIPCRNEEDFIENTLNSIIESDYSIENLEILIADGRSDDKTREIVENFEMKYSQIRLIDNPEKTVPYAMNYAIKEAKGDIIIRLDAHSIYPKDYISKLVYWIKELDAENVGGVWDTIPANDSLVSKIIAYSSLHSFGIGNAQYRISDKTEPYEVDTVPFGCYKKEVFEKIGLFDTDLTRNQDDELNARLIQNGGKIFLIPDLKIQYFARDTFKKMFKMFYQYGLFKPLVNLKLKQPATLRQFVPPVFVLFLIFGTILSIYSSLFLALFAMGLSIYFGVDILVSYKIAKEKKNLKLFPYLVYSFFLIHTSYGLGYLKGIVDFMILKKHKKNDLSKINTSR
jgi:glycosyltransferase involved in cell wall biosynthesis